MTRRLLTSVALAVAMLAVTGCQALTMLWNRDLSFSYLGDDAGTVDRASVASDTRVIATARRVGTRPAADPALTELDVDETHFVRGTRQVVYTGRIVFHCRATEAWCTRVRVTRVSGARPRDVFRKWSSKIGATRGSYPL